MAKKINISEIKHFYYDESYHDLSITQKDGIQNINTKNASTYFVVSFVGVKEDKTNDFLNKYQVLEQEYKNLIGQKEDYEFKGTIINSKNYNKGFSSMRKVFIRFYTKLFDLLDEYSVIINISTISKFEIVVSRIFINHIIELGNLFDDKTVASFIYGTTKFLEQHKTEKLVELMHSNKYNSKELLMEIKKIINHVLATRLNSELKNRECNFASHLNLLINNIEKSLNIEEKYKWDYSFSFDGFNNLLNELNIRSENIYLDIDEKGSRTQKIYDTAIVMFPDATIKRFESKDNLGIRISDFISNLIGRFIKVIEDECTDKQKKIEENADFNKKISLDEEWFNLDEEAFDCYRKIGEFFNNRSKIYWTTHVGTYDDIPLVVYSLFQYFYEQKNYEDFKNISSFEHSEKLNNLIVCKHIYRHEL